MSKKKFVTPFSLDTVFSEELKDDSESDFRLFVHSRRQRSTLDLDLDEKWRSLWTLNRFLCGFLVLTKCFRVTSKTDRLHTMDEHFIYKGQRPLPGTPTVPEHFEAGHGPEFYRAIRNICPRKNFCSSFYQIFYRQITNGHVSPARFSARKRTSAYIVGSATLSHLWFVTTVLETMLSRKRGLTLQMSEVEQQRYVLRLWL